MLAVLKALLLALLFVVFAVVLAVALILFVSIRYSFYAEKEDAVLINGRLSWMFGAVRFSVSYRDEKVDYALRVLGIECVGSEKTRSKKEKTFAGVRKKERTAQKKESASEKKEPALDKKEQAAEKKETASEKKEQAAEKKETASEKKEQAAEKKGSAAQRKESGGDKKKSAAKSGNGQKKNRVNSIKSVAEKILKIKGLLFSKAAADFIRVVKNALARLFKRIKPKKTQGALLFGTGDPCLTGEALGAMAAFMAASGIWLDVTPDFENKDIRGNIEIAGGFRIAAFAMAAARIIVSRECRIFYREAMKLKEEL